MRIAILNDQGGCVGGMEIYLQRLLPALKARGHTVRFLQVWPPYGNREPIEPEGAVSLAGMGDDAAMARVGEGDPEVLYLHGPIPGTLVVRLVERWPTVAFQHGYFGTCISGLKQFQTPPARPCHRRFGWACLACYYPMRCGGWSPRAMWRAFQSQRRWLDAMRRFDRIACHSEHMRQELNRHGIAAARIRVIPFLVPAQPDAETAATARALPDEGPLRIVCLGRLNPAKGVGLLVRALPEASGRVGRPLHLTVAGDGPQRAALERLARSVGRDARVAVAFAGWVQGPAKAALLNGSHLLAVPSVWPEPFGQTGVEAGHHGLPAVAFDVGGVRAWLKPGVNGQLAPGRPPRASELATAIVGCLGDAAAYRALSAGAIQEARTFGGARHLEALEGLFADAIAARLPRAS